MIKTISKMQKNEWPECPGRVLISTSTLICWYDAGDPQILKEGPTLCIRAEPRSSRVQCAKQLARSAPIHNHSDNLSDPTPTEPMRPLSSLNFLSLAALWRRIDGGHYTERILRARRCCGITRHPVRTEWGSLIISCLHRLHSRGALCPPVAPRRLHDTIEHVAACGYMMTTLHTLELTIYKQRCHATPVSSAGLQSACKVRPGSCRS